MPSLVEIGPVVLKKMKMWKVYDNANNDDDDDDNDDNDWQRTNFDQKSWLEPLDQVSPKACCILVNEFDSPGTFKLSRASFDICRIIKMEVELNVI